MTAAATALLPSFWQRLALWLGLVTAAATALLPSFWQRLALWLGLARETEPKPAQAGSGTQDDEAGEARRKSVHDVTLEQLGIAHWTSHTLF